MEIRSNSSIHTKELPAALEPILAHRWTTAICPDSASRADATRERLAPFADPRHISGTRPRFHFGGSIEVVIRYGRHAAVRPIVVEPKLFRASPGGPGKLVRNPDNLFLRF